MGCPRGHKESDTTERLSTQMHHALYLPLNLSLKGEVLGQVGRWVYWVGRGCEGGRSCHLLGSNS